MLPPAKLPLVQPIVPVLRPAAFNDPAWLFEPKYDGFRGIVYLTGGRCAIYSKRRNRFSRFSELETRLCGAFPTLGVILDGEVVAFGPDGRVSFWHLMRGEGTLGYVAFDLLWSCGRDLRGLPLIERKKRLAGIIPAQTGIICSTLTIDEHGQELFEAVCGLDLEGIVAKRKADPYEVETRWFKIKNPAYSQAAGRRELFDRWSGREQQATEAVENELDGTATFRLRAADGTQRVIVERCVAGRLVISKACSFWSSAAGLEGSAHPRNASVVIIMLGNRAGLHWRTRMVFS